MIRDALARISGYPGLFAACVGSGWLLPFPEDVVLLYAGVKLGGGHLAWAPTLAVTCLGVLIRDLLAWGAGRLLGEWLLGQRVVVRLVGRRRLERARRMVAEREHGAILVGRFLVGVRAPVFLVAGAAGVPFGRFVLLDTLGVLVAVPGAVVLGWAFGEPLIDVVFWALGSTRVLLGLAMIGGAAWWWRRRARLAAALPDEASSEETAS